MKERFPDHLWLDVVSKCDILQDSPVVFVTEKVDEKDPELSKYRKSGPDGSLFVSVMTEAGLSEVIGLFVATFAIYIFDFGCIALLLFPLICTLEVNLISWPYNLKEFKI